MKKEFKMKKDFNRLIYSKYTFLYSSMGYKLDNAYPIYKGHYNEKDILYVVHASILAGDNYNSSNDSLSRNDRRINVEFYFKDADSLALAFFSEQKFQYL